MQTPAPFLLTHRRPCALAMLVILGFATRARAEDPTPHAPPADRYNKMAAHSPFAPPTELVKPPPTATPPPAPSWSDKLTVTMLMQDHGVFYATVVDPDSPQHLYLNSLQADPTSHLMVGPVQWNPTGGQAQPMVTLIKGAERSQVRYEPGSGASGAVLPPPRGAGIPGIPAPNLYRPPVPQPTPGMVGPVPNSAVLRRAPIRAVPPPPAAGGAGRPVVLPGDARSVQPVRPVSQPIKTDDDDDDD